MRRALQSAILLVAAAAVAAPACRPRNVGESEASAQYRTAWAKRRAGDEAGYQAAMNQIASRWPDSRAGRRARQITAGSGGGQGTMMGAAMAGVMAAVAVPAFIKYRAQASALGSATAQNGPPGLPLLPRVESEPVGHLPKGRPASAQKGWEPLNAPARKR